MGLRVAGEKEWKKTVPTFTLQFKPEVFAIPDAAVTQADHLPWVGVAVATGNIEVTETQSVPSRGLSVIREEPTAHKWL